jgi:hypothetical protein
MLNEFARRRLITGAHPRQATGEVERFVIRHSAMDSLSYTHDKTPPTPTGYILPLDATINIYLVYPS